MPLLDLTNQPLSSFSPTSTGATFDDYIDLLAKTEYAAGNPVDCIVQVAATATSGGSATVQFQLIGNATDPTFASGNVVLADSGAIAVASLVIGYQIRMTAKRQNIVSQQATSTFVRYVTILVTIGTAALTAGTFNGWVAPSESPQDNLSYPAGYTV